jgi:hypothetical protein
MSQNPISDEVSYRNKILDAYFQIENELDKIIRRYVNKKHGGGYFPRNIVIDRASKKFTFDLEPTCPGITIYGRHGRHSLSLDLLEDPFLDETLDRIVSEQKEEERKAREAAVCKTCGHYNPTLLCW